MKRIFTLICLLAVEYLFAYAVETGPRKPHFANNLSVDSVDPEADAVFLNKMRHRLDSIRTNEHRPTVALVLGGGGAKGATEIGVFRLLEEVDMPIDVICGTSIGGLMGGMYSMGYDSYYIDSLMRSQDWGWTLSDKVDQSHIPYVRKDFKSKYQLSIPFHYEEDVLQQRLKEQEKYSTSDGKIHITPHHNGAEFEAAKSTSAMASSLPSGYVYGLNVNNLLSSLTVGYQDSLDFCNLPVPFFCVATDVVSMKAKLWAGGQLKTAMRSTMSIPALFTPVRTQGMVLVDGGTRNNFPVDLAKSMGADYIIGVDLLNDVPTYAQVNNLGNLLGQFVTMLSKDSYGETLPECDIYIKPDVTGYSSLSFNPSAIDTLIRRGYEAAMLHKGEIDSLKSLVGGKSPLPVKRPGLDISHRSVMVNAIIFEGLKDYESRILQKMIGLKAGTMMDRAHIERAVSIIQSSGAVETVSYSLLGEEEPYRLVFKCAKTPVHELGIGLRLDTEVWAEIGVHLGLGTRKLSGPKLEIDAKLGMSQSIGAHFILDYPDFPTINAEVNADFINGDLLTMSGSGYDWLKFKSGYISHQEKLYLSSTTWKRGNLNAGFRNRFFALKENVIGSQFFGLDSLTQHKGDYFGLFINGNYYTLDDPYFPSRGLHMSAGYYCDFAKVGVKEFEPINSIYFDIKGAIPMGERVTLIPDFHIRNVFDKQNRDIDASLNPIPSYSLAHRNFIGGTISGRYIEQQVPFVGMNNTLVCGVTNTAMVGDYTYTSLDHIGVLNIDLRVNVLKNLYISALGGYMHAAPTFKDLFGYNRISKGNVRYNQYKDLFGAGLQVSYKTIAGPVAVKVHWCDRTSTVKDNIGFYLSAGFDF